MISGGGCQYLRLLPPVLGQVFTHLYSHEARAGASLLDPRQTLSISKICKAPALTQEKKLSGLLAPWKRLLRGAAKYIRKCQRGPCPQTRPAVGVGKSTSPSVSWATTAIVIMETLWKYHVYIQPCDTQGSVDDNGY